MKTGRIYRLFVVRLQFRLIITQYCFIFCLKPGFRKDKLVGIGVSFE